MHREESLFGIARLPEHVLKPQQPKPIHRHPVGDGGFDEAADYPLPAAPDLGRLECHLVLEEFVHILVDRGGSADLGPMLQRPALVPTTVGIRCQTGEFSLDRGEHAHQAPGDEVFAEALVGELEGLLPAQVAGLAEIE